MSQGAELVMETVEESQPQAQTSASLSQVQPAGSVKITQGAHTASASPSAANITYDKLFEILRIERTDPNLQKLLPTFFADVRAYLQVKQDSVEKSKNSSDLFAAEHVETAQQQIKNATRILTDIYDRRERKIMNLALNKAKAASHSIDTSHLLAEEKALFTQIVSMLAAQRNTTQQLLTAASSPSQFAKVSPMTLAANASITAEQTSPIASASSTSSEQIAVSEKKYDVIEEISEFFGPDMQHYGPFAKGDQAAFSDQIARILLKKNLVKQL